MKLGHSKTSKSTIRGAAAISVVLFVVVLSIMIAGLGNTSISVQRQGQRTAEEAIRRAAVSCYALEGAYPESYEYLKEKYGVKINERLYVVDYNVFASNIMPDITVIKR